MQLTRRPRRNRKSAAIRELIQENRLHASDFVVPLFILEGENRQEEIRSMPGIYRRSLDLTIKEVEHLCALGIRAVDLFPVIPSHKKDPGGSEAWNPNGLCARAITTLKEAFPELCVMVDLALDPYTDHGHDGLMNPDGEILNDETVEVLARAAVVQAEAGVDVVAPSDMMDGRIGHLRRTLDEEGFSGVSLLSYSAKYASAFYGPFRDALHSAPKSGDKKSYQMDSANSREALVELALDEAEGADMVMVKPALAYLDVITQMRAATSLPVAAYHVSGEYAMVMAAGEKGWLDAERVMAESLLSIKRAGADLIFTYAAPMVLSS